MMVIQIIGAAGVLFIVMVTVAGLVCFKDSLLHRDEFEEFMEQERAARSAP